MDKITNFMSIQNLQNLMAIFEKFMIDRYSISIQDNPNIKIKQIIFETMNKVKQQSDNQNIPIIELNKITLSIVKNVVKNKLSLDSSNSKGSSLMRDRDVRKNKNTQLHNITRPQPSSNTQGMFSYDVNEQFDELSSIRANENAPPFIPDSALPSNNKLDDAMSTEDFVKKLNFLEQSRDTGSITKMNSTVEENNTSTNTAWLSDVYKNNAEVHPKELYSTKPDIMEHFTQESANLRDVLTKREFINNIIKPIPSSSPSPTPKTNTKYLIIDSRDRDSTKHANANEYIIDLDNIIKNIVNIEFWYAQYTKPTTSEHYINMHIQEFDVDNFTKNNNFKDAFVQLPLTGDNVIILSGSDYGSTKTFQTPLSKLSKLHVRFTQYNGDLFENMTEHLLRFKVTYIQSDQVVENDLLSSNDHNNNNTKSDKDEESAPMAANTDALEDDLRQQI
jgi:hypothetical protein